MMVKHIALDVICWEHWRNCDQMPFLMALMTYIDLVYGCCFWSTLCLDSLSTRYLMYPLGRYEL